MSTGSQAAPISAGEVYIFEKSGNEVRTVEPADPYMGQACWTVVRTKGESAGKQMTVPASSLKKELN